MTVFGRVGMLSLSFNRLYQAVHKVTVKTLQGETDTFYRIVDITESIIRVIVNMISISISSLQSLYNRYSLNCWWQVVVRLTMILNYISHHYPQHLNGDVGTFTVRPPLPVEVG